jgi:acetylornithine deacetylase/succinyl-diaminopimelate desuccinylase-like protein
MTLASDESATHSTQEALDRILACVDEQAACQLAMDLAAIPSPTGEEAAIGEFILDWYVQHGLEPVRQEPEDGRLNAVGILRGWGGGPSLMFNGHMDTGTPMRHEDIVGVVPKPVPVIQPRIEDGIIWGTGLDNMKSGLAANLSAARAIRESGVPLRGDLIVACVAGEVGRAPVDQYQGRHYRSKGVGTRYLLTHGMVSDYAIVSDTSHFGLTWAECGVVYAKISTSGRGLYTPFTQRADDPRQSSNAIIKMMSIIEAVERWARDYERRHVHRFGAGEVHPKVSIGSIMAGAPFRVANTPLSCSLYVDIRVAPNKLPIEAQRELKSALDTAGVDYKVDFYLSQRGYEHQGVEPLVEAIQHAHQLVSGEPLKPIHPAQTSMWTDTNLYYEAGIPAVKIGTGAALKRSADGELGGMIRLFDTTSVEDLMKLTRIFAVAATRICGVA